MNRSISRRRGTLGPTSPEGKYWFERHKALIDVLQEMANSDDEAIKSIGWSVLDVEAMLDLQLIKTMKEKVVTTEDNLIIVDEFKPKDPGIAPGPKTK